MIEAYVGLPGGGKSYALAERAAREIRSGRVVFSNTPIRGTYKVNPEWLVRGRLPADSVVLLDELGLVFNSREWGLFGKEHYEVWCQHRKGGLDLIYAVQAPARVDVSIRELTAIWWECSAFRLFGDSPVFFTQKAYMDSTDCFSGAEPWKERKMLPRKMIYESFDTLWRLEDKIKEEVPLVLWPFNEKEKKPGLWAGLKERFLVHSSESSFSSSSSSEPK